MKHIAIRAGGLGFDFRASQIGWSNQIGITMKRVTSGRAHFRGLAPGQRSSAETSKQLRAVGDTMLDLNGPENEP